jgi:hypothetical protein
LVLRRELGGFADDDAWHCIICDEPTPAVCPFCSQRVCETCAVRCLNRCPHCRSPHLMFGAPTVHANLVLDISDAIVFPAFGEGDPELGELPPGHTDDGFSDDEVAHTSDESSLFSSPVIEAESPDVIDVDDGVDEQLNVSTFLDEVRARLLSRDAVAPRVSSEEPPARRRRILPATFVNVGFQLFVKPFQGDSIMLRVTPDTTIFAVKRAFIIAIGAVVLQPRDVRLINNGRQLVDTCTLNHYNIRQGDTVHSLFRVRGGAPGDEPPSKCPRLAPLVPAVALSSDDYFETVMFVSSVMDVPTPDVVSTASSSAPPDSPFGKTGGADEEVVENAEPSSSDDESSTSSSSDEAPGVVAMVEPLGLLN